VATDAPIAPLKKTVGPWALNFALNLEIPSFPSTCMMVLTVSIGINKILKLAAQKLDTKVFIEVFNSLVDSLAFIKAITPVFEKVSPNLDNGPCSKAGTNPL